MLSCIGITGEDIIGQLEMPDKATKKGVINKNDYMYGLNTESVKRNWKAARKKIINLLDTQNKKMGNFVFFIFVLYI